MSTIHSRLGLVKVAAVMGLKRAVWQADLRLPARGHVLTCFPDEVWPHGVVETPLERLRVWPENPRRITQARLDDLKRALEADREMLRARPLLALPDGLVFAGNQRLRAARELDWQTIPVLFVDLDPGRARLWALRDNSAWGEWDEPLLSEPLAELSAGGVDLVLTGFASSDLDRILGSLQPTKDPDDAPPLPDGEPEPKRGEEVYELGSHRLQCGEATDRAVIATVTNGTDVSVIWTDPQYGIEYVGKTAAALTIANDQADGLPELLRDGFTTLDAVLEPSARFYVCSPAGHAGGPSSGWPFARSPGGCTSRFSGSSRRRCSATPITTTNTKRCSMAGSPARVVRVAVATAARVGTATTARRACSSSIGRLEAASTRLRSPRGAVRRLLLPLPFGPPRLCLHFSSNEGVSRKPAIHAASRAVGRLWAGDSGAPRRKMPTSHHVFAPENRSHSRPAPGGARPVKRGSHTRDSAVGTPSATSAPRSSPT
jgi:ParB-like nuclease domain